MGMGMSYEEMIDFNLRDTALEVELYYVGREEEPLEIPDKHRWDEEHEWFIEWLEKDLSDNNIPYSSV